MLPTSSDTPHQVWIEAASWRIASQLLGRHPDLSVIRTHPGGGMYDVLCVFNSSLGPSGPGVKIMLNRSGTIQVHGRVDGSSPPVAPISWADALVDPVGVVDFIESEAGLANHVAVRAAAPRGVVARSIALIVGLATPAMPFSVTQGFVDASGPGGSYDELWWSQLADDVDGYSEPDSLPPGSRFWRVERHDFELTFDMSTAAVWTPKRIEELAAVARRAASIEHSTPQEWGDLMKARQRLAKGTDLLRSAKISDQHSQDDLNHDIGANDLDILSALLRLGRR